MNKNLFDNKIESRTMYPNTTCTARWEQFFKIALRLCKKKLVRPKIFKVLISKKANALLKVEFAERTIDTPWRIKTAIHCIVAEIAKVLTKINSLAGKFENWWTARTSCKTSWIEDSLAAFWDKKIYNNLAYVKK